MIASRFPLSGGFPAVGILGGDGALFLSDEGSATGGGKAASTGRWTSSNDNAATSQGETFVHVDSLLTLPPFASDVDFDAPLISPLLLR